MKTPSVLAGWFALVATVAVPSPAAPPPAGELREPREKTIRRAPERPTVATLTRELAPRLAACAGDANNEKLWAKVRADLSAVLDAHWRRGALLGTKADEAYFVRCDRSTMTAAEIQAGTLKVIVGFAAVKPAEFEILALQQAVQRP